MILPRLLQLPVLYLRRGWITDLVPYDSAEDAAGLQILLIGHRRQHVHMPDPSKLQCCKKTEARDFMLGQKNMDAPDTVFAGYPANLKAGYRISGRILGLTTIFLVKYQINL
jgi:hypothetical protein